MSNYPPHSHHPHFSSRPGQFMGPQSHPHPGSSRFAQTGNAADVDPYTGMPYAMPQGQGFFPGASHPFFNNPMMVDNSTNNVNVLDAGGGPVIRMLYEASIKGTEIDSDARHPPPRCHPGTRKTITAYLYTWMEDGQRKSNLTWIFGFAGVGKTAVAQTVGEWAKENSLLGAAFFFSRTRNHTDPSRVFISIAHQLASRNEQYRHIVANHLSTDVGLLDKDIRTQFKKLLVEPLSELKLDKKLVIIIDGLDECEGQADQCTIIDLVNGAASSPTPLPVIWMICSRPESQIKQTFFQAVFQADFRINYIKKEVAVDDSETRRDIKNYIQDGFKDIVRGFTLQDDVSWPAAGDVDKVVSAASGLFIYASTIVKYVGDENYADPEGQLNEVIAFIEDSPARPITEDPLYYLDKLYEQIISRVPARSLQLVLQIIAVSSFYPALPAQQLANLFGLSQIRFYGLLLQLHSVIEVPLGDKASKDNIQVFHASFMDFLKNPARAGRFTLNEQDVHAKFIGACLKVLGKTKFLYSKKLTWTSKDDPPAFLLAHHIIAYCATNVWSACTKLGGASASAAAARESRDVIDKIIIDFDFLLLRFVEDKLPVSQFYDFCLWLRKQIQKHDLEDIIQPVNWNTDRLQERFGECTIDSDGNEALRCFTLGKKAKRITVMMSSDQLMLSRED